jgi:hypothetical protein
METWKKLDGFDCDYEISDHGQIRNSKTKKVLKLQKEIRKSDGYVKVRCNLIKNNKSVKPVVSRLVLATFSPIKNSHQYHVDHIDFDSTNNRLQNLRWLEPQKNCSARRTAKYYESQLKIKDKVIEELRRKIEELSAPL